MAGVPAPLERREVSRSTDAARKPGSGPASAPASLVTLGHESILIVSIHKIRGLNTGFLKSVLALHSNN